MERKPEWLDKKINLSSHFDIDDICSRYSLKTVCKEAFCPNITECFKQRHLTFMILGGICTRGCSFCNVSKGTPLPPDKQEPENIARAVSELNLSDVVITSPSRDDLEDYGVSQFIQVVRKIRLLSLSTSIELVIPDFRGVGAILQLLLKEKPDTLTHNIETVPRLYSLARSGSDYLRSLGVLRSAAEYGDGIIVKSGLMLGLGEKDEEVTKVLVDLYSAGCMHLAVGQYLKPSKLHHPVVDYIHPDYFADVRKRALDIGFLQVACSPYTRSSYRNLE